MGWFYTLGMCGTASGVFSHRSGLTARACEHDKPHEGDDVLELVRIGLPQLGRQIDRLDGDSDRVAFADYVQRGKQWTWGTYRPSGVRT